MKTKQLANWQEDFGNAYTDRNVVQWTDRVPGWQQVVGGLQISSILEVGCNRGHNLLALRKVLGRAVELAGVEPNRYALSIAQGALPRARVVDGDVFELPFESSSFDLVFTSGVLIHVALADLASAMTEIHRVSRLYVLAVEYFADQETAIPYRGHADLLWKRDFPAHYRKNFPDLQMARSGYLEDWDRAHWWLFEKPNPPTLGLWVA